MMIDLTCKDPTSLYKFFDKNGYLFYIEEHTPDCRAEEYVRFAQLLLETNCFTHFMDGYTSEDLENFDLVNSILCFRGELK